MLFLSVTERDLSVVGATSMVLNVHILRINPGVSALLALDKGMRLIMLFPSLMFSSFPSVGYLTLGL